MDKGRSATIPDAECRNPASALSIADTYPMTAASSCCYALGMVFSRELILDALARLLFIDAGDLSMILGETLATVHRALAGLLQDGLAHQAGPRPSLR